MLQGHIELKNRERAEIDKAARSFLQAGGTPVQLEPGARTELGTGRDRMRLYVITPEGKVRKPEHALAPKPARDPAAVKASARRAAKANSAARKAERDALLGAVQEFAASGATRTLAAERLGISLNNLRRITDEHAIHFARDRGLARFIGR